MEVCTETGLIALEDPATVGDGAFQIGEGPAASEPVQRGWVVNQDAVSDCLIGRPVGQQVE